MAETHAFRTSRRRITTGIAAAALAPAALWTGAARAAQQVFVRTPGGSFDDVKRETIYEPFRKETGIEIVPVASTTAKLIAMFKAGQNELDLIDTGDSPLLELEHGKYLQPIAYDEFKYTNPGRHRPGREAQVPARQLHLRDRARLQHQGDRPGQRAQVVGRVLGHQGISRPAHPARHGVRPAAARVRADRRRRADGQALSDRHRPRVQVAVPDPRRGAEILGHRRPVGADAGRQGSRRWARCGAGAPPVADRQGAPLAIAVEPEHDPGAGLRHPVGAKNARQRQEVHRLQPRLRRHRAR